MGGAAVGAPFFLPPDWSLPGRRDHLAGMTNPAIPRPRARCTTLVLGLLVAAAPLAAQATPSVLDALRYRAIGPTQGGRVTAVTGVPQRPGTF